MYVAIHELAHIACESVGHTDEFWDIFKKMLFEGAKIKIYKPVDYSVNPTSYCGTIINEMLSLYSNRIVVYPIRLQSCDYT